MKSIENIIREVLKEGYNEQTYYMFFQNLEQIKNQCEELLMMDKNMVDQILKSGHDWAADHVSTSKDDIEEVYNFFKHKPKKNIDNNQIGFVTENDLKEEDIVKLSHEVFELYMDSDKTLKSEIRNKWADEGLARTGKFSGNNINRILSNNKPSKTMDIMEVIDQLEIVKDFIKDSKIDKLVNLITKKY
jgi:hypothetical protein